MTLGRGIFLSLALLFPLGALHGQGDKDNAKTYTCPTEMTYELSVDVEDVPFKYQGVGSDLDTTFVQASLHSELDQEVFSCAYTWKTGDKAQFFLETPMDPNTICQFQGEEVGQKTCPHGDLTACVLVCTPKANPTQE